MSYGNWSRRVDFSELLGKTLVKVWKEFNADEKVIFHCSDGSIYELFHDQDYCESVWLEDVDNDLHELIGSPILRAEEVVNFYDPPIEDSYESYTWTFYKLSTNKASVTMRWYGTSNGYYSEYVDLHKVKEPDNA